MLNRYLTEHSLGCFYANKQMIKALKDQFAQAKNKSVNWHQIQQNCYVVLANTLDQRHPRLYRLNDIHMLMEALCDGHLFTSPELPWLEDVYQQLMMRNGDLVCYRENQVQAYVRLAAEIDPTLIVAWHLSDWQQQNPKPLAQDIQRIVKGQHAFFAPPGNPESAYAEGHVHLGGINADSIILSKYLLEKELPELKTAGNQNEYKRLQYQELLDVITQARRLLILLLQGKWAQAEPSTQTRWWQFFYPAAIEDIQEFGDWQLLAERFQHTKASSPDWVLGQFASAMHSQCANSWLWLQLYLCSLYRHPHTTPQIRAAILCFIQLSNETRRCLVMDGQGLSRFTKYYYNSPLDKGPSISQDNIRRLFAGQQDVAEVKAMPGFFQPQNIIALNQHILALQSLQAPQAPYIFAESKTPQNYRSQAYLQQMERWHFCGHFSRSPSKKQALKAPKVQMKKIWQQGERLLENLNQESGWALPEFLGGNANQHFQFKPANWFRGLDVAGDENDLKIEYFAPVLRWLRRGFLSRPGLENSIPGFHLSIHAGEDYAHPVSGMRHVDETVLFCEMRDGDRLGHALALGIPPQDWVQRQSEMILPLDEHIDNLVWLWHYASLLSNQLPMAQQVLPILERRIARFEHEIVQQWLQPLAFGAEGKHESPKATPVQQPVLSPEVLYQAWLLRRNCHYHLQAMQQDVPRNEKDKIAVPDIHKLRQQEHLASRLYAGRHIYLRETQRPTVIVRYGQAEHHYYEPEKAERTGKPLEDVDSPLELEFMHALQDYLLSTYDCQGIIIETNPTSNVYIARLNKHSEHPIFRWSPPDETSLESGQIHNKYGLRKGPVRVLVNTDDPGITPTTLRTEYLLLREAALELGVGRTVAERWLESLRLYGLEQFHRNHLPVFSTTNS